MQRTSLVVTPLASNAPGFPTVFSASGAPTARRRFDRHAYGFAGDLPTLLKELYTFPPEASANSEPWHTLWSSLYHQGDIYSASYAAVAVIVDAAASDAFRASASYFHLPACIELARVRHRANVPRRLSKLYADALVRLPRIAAESTSNNSLQADKGKLSRHLRAHMVRPLAFAAELSR